MNRTLATSLVLAPALTLSACSDSGYPDMDMPGMGSSGTTSPDSDRDTRQDEEFDHADVMFSRMMIPHHEQAIEMSDLILGKDGVDPQITDLATRIKEAQGPEIVQMTAWLDEWASRARQAWTTTRWVAVRWGGKMSEDDMRALEDAEGTQAGRLFLEGMIVHHRGAIEMAQAEIDSGTRQGTIDLARSIVESQTCEIQVMENLLAGG